MNRSLLAIVVMSAGVCSCSKEVQPLSKQEVNHRIDSILKTRIQESDNNARRDLEHRIKIEVKPKVDSIVKARLQHAGTDTAKTNNTPAK